MTHPTPTPGAGEFPQLLPCPFCGGKKIFVEPDERGSGGQHVSPYHVGCSACKCEQLADKKLDAIAAWNRRGIDLPRWEDAAEIYLADIISKSPEPLRELGGWLATRLDEDDWKTAERYVLGAMNSIAALRAQAAEGGKEKAVEEANGRLGVAIALLAECLGPLEVSAAIIESEDGGEAMGTLIEQVRKFVAAVKRHSIQPQAAEGEQSAALRAQAAPTAAAEEPTDAQLTDVIQIVRNIFGGQSGSSDRARWDYMNARARESIRAALQSVKPKDDGRQGE